MPPWLQNAIETGTKTVDGVKYPQVLPTRNISPVSQPWEILDTIRNNPGANSIGAMLNPGITAAWYTSHHQGPFGQDIKGGGSAAYLESLKENALHIAPQAGLVGDLMHPPAEGGLYPEDVTRGGRLKRAVRVVPIAINPEEAYKARKRLGMEGDLYKTSLHEFEQRSHKLGFGKPPASVLEDLRWKVKIDQEVHKHAETSDGHIDYLKAVQVVAKIYDERYHSALAHSYADIKDVRAAENDYLILRKSLYQDYSIWNLDMQHEEDARVGG
jgi:hypothetical protein